jgi:hypothetical protein
LRHDDRPWSRPRCESLGFQESFDIRRKRLAPRRLEARFDIAREIFKQGCALLDAIALKHPESVRV